MRATLIVLIWLTLASQYAPTPQQAHCGGNTPAHMCN